MHRRVNEICQNVTNGNYDKYFCRRDNEWHYFAFTLSGSSCELDLMHVLFLHGAEQPTLFYCICRGEHYSSSFTNYRFSENSFLEVKVKPNFGRGRISQFIHYQNEEQQREIIAQYP